MQALQSISPAPVLNESQPSSTPVPTFTNILAAPEDQWRTLATLADADIAFCDHARACRKAQVINPTPKRTRRAYRPRPSRSNRNWPAAIILTSPRPGDG